MPAARFSLSSWVLRRDDQVGCPLFEPIDRADRSQSREPWCDPLVVLPDERGRALPHSDAPLERTMKA